MQSDAAEKLDILIEQASCTEIKYASGVGVISIKKQWTKVRAKKLFKIWEDEHNPYIKSTDTILKTLQ